MEDYAARISELLGSPEGLEKIKAVGSLLGGLTEGSDHSDESDFQDFTVGEKESESSGGFDPNMMETMMQLLPLLSGLNEDDKNTTLIKALRPHLSNRRQERAETAVTILRLFSLLPLLDGKLF